MTASGRYGLLLGLTLVPLMSFGPRPGAQIVVGALLSLQLVVAAVLVWRRMGLRLAPASMFTAAVGTGLLARILASSPDLFAAPIPVLVVFGALLSLAAFLMFAQSRTEPGLWGRWRQHLDNVTVMDVLRLRHIPDLRGARSHPGM